MYPNPLTIRCIPDEIDKVLSAAAVIATRNLRTADRGKTIFRLGGFAHSREIPILDGDLE